MCAKPNKEHGKPKRLKDFPYRGRYRYFITIRSHDFNSLLVHDAVVNKALETLKTVAKQERFSIWAYCFMPDHVHLLVEGQDSDADMRHFVSSFKQRTGYWYKRTHNGRLWSFNYYEHVLRGDQATVAVAEYIIRNPVRRGMVEHSDSYPYSGSFELDDTRNL
jgi:putative transposase